MKKFTLLSLTTILVNTTSFAATDAHEIKGWYFNPTANYNYLKLNDIYTSMNLEQNYPALAKTSTESADFGYGLAVGYGLKNYPIRFALEYSSPQNIRYDSNPLYNTAYTNYLQNFRSNVTSYHVMANVIFDFPLIDGALTPYALAGVGYAHNRTNFTDSYIDQNTGSYVTQNKQSIDTGIAWQAGLGSAVKLFDGLYANGEVRYVDLGKVSWNNFYAPQDGDKYSIETKNFSSYQASLGLIWAFGGCHTKAA